jgi:hypothetical protein
MDLTQINDEAFRRELTRRLATPLHETYDDVLKQALPSRLQELVRRLDSVPYEPVHKPTSR